MAKERKNCIFYNNEFYKVFYNKDRQPFIEYACEKCGKLRNTRILYDEPQYKLCAECSNKSEERAIKISNSLQGHEVLEDRRLNISKGKIGKHIKTYVKSEEHIQKIKNTLLNKHYHLTDETKTKMSKSLKEKWNTFSEDKKFHIIYAGRKNKRKTRPECIIESLLNYLFKDTYKYCGDNSSVINGVSPDFININGQKKVIEVFGDYWHGEKVTGKSNNDVEQEKIKKYKEYGFDCLIIWEREIKDDNNEHVMNKLITFNNTKCEHKQSDMFNLEVI